jgi:hypothetical protein
MTSQPTTQDDLLELWRRLFPLSYTRGIEFENDGQGFVPFQAWAAMLARVAEATAVSSQAYYLLPSSLAVRPWAAGAQAATGVVQIHRSAPAWADLLIPAGTLLVARLRTSDGTVVDGPEFALVDDVAIPGGSLGPVPAAVRSTRVGYQGNLPPTRISAFVTLGTATVVGTATAPDVLQDNGQPDRFTLSMLGRYLRITSGPDASPVPRRIVDVVQTGATVTVRVDGPVLLGGPFVAEVEEWEDLGLTVDQPDATSGGRHGWLDAIAYDRGLFRQLGETDEQLRARVASLDDVVSPGAVIRLCDRLLTPAGIPWRLIEAGDPVLLTAFRWELGAGGTGAVEQVTIDFATRRRMFAIALGPTGQGEDGTQLDTVLGATDTNDLDGDATLDGGPQQWLAVLAALRAQLDRIRAAGVAALILIDPIYY